MADWLSPKQRVVVTGLGAITPCGIDVATTWVNVREGQSGISKIELFDTAGLDVKIAGEVRGFSPLDYMNTRDAQRADRNVQFALVAAKQAANQANLPVDCEDRYDIGVIIGSGAGGVETYTKNQAAMNEKGVRGLHPTFIPMLVVDSAAAQVSLQFRACGTSLGIASACSTSTDAIGLALETIRRGDAYVIIAGGSEAPITKLGVGGFYRMNALSHNNENPKAASRPFDADRDGFVLSEGAAILVLESLEHALQRGAKPLAELRSYYSTSDARHLTSPDQSGASAIRCISRALEKAKISPDQVNYINAHATGTLIGDTIEAKVIRDVFGTHVAVSSTKSTTGHLLGAAGALATVLTICALQEGYFPPTINLTNPDPTCDLNHIIIRPKTIDAKFALVSSYGFGGHNSCIVIEKWGN